MDNQDYYDQICYECGGNGDDFHFDEGTGEWVRNCIECPYSEESRENDEW